MKRLKLIGYWLIHAVWGFPTFIFGVLVAIFMLITGHKPHRFGYSIYFITRREGGWGFEAGPFFVITSDQKDSLSIKQHEHGHGIQTLWWGPLMVFVISIPSVIRFYYREYSYFKAKKTKTKEEFYEYLRNRPKYDDIWFEGQATRLGEKYFS